MLIYPFHQEAISFTSLTPKDYLALPQLKAQMDVSFSCVMLTKKTGTKEFFIMVHWVLCGTDISQVVYMKAPVLSHTIPPLIEMQRAIHTAIVALNGKLGGADTPHRPVHIRILNRWTRPYFDSVRGPLNRAGIACSFQTREEAEAECAKEGME